MNFTGGATFTATNALEDDGNNSGISITLAGTGSTSYYWVGGTGNWSDPTHWALSSGGAGQGADGCIPDANDDVYFDANSFSAPGQTVTVDIDGARCRNMDWTGATNTPTFSASGSAWDILEIHGSLTFISAMNHACWKIFHFKGTSAGNTITSAGQSFSNDVKIIAPGGEYILQDDFSVGTTNRDFYVTEGTFRTNDQDVFIKDLFTCTGNSTRALYFGSSTVTIAGSSFTISGTGLTLDMGTSTIEFSGSSGGLSSSTAAYDFYNIVCSNAGGTSTINAYGGSTFNNIIFSGNGRLYKTGDYSTANTFNKVVFAEDATIRYNNTYDSLLFQGTYNTLNFYANATQTVNSYLYFCRRILCFAEHHKIFLHYNTGDRQHGKWQYRSGFLQTE